MKSHRATRDWPDSTVAIVGSGPSALDFDFSKIAGLRTVAVKDGYLLTPKADVLMIGDHRYANRRPDLSKYLGPLILYTDPKPLPPELSDERIQRMTKIPGRGLSFDPNFLRGTFTTTCLAINYAVLRGATTIYLIGIDGKPGPNNERHFTGDTIEDWPTRYEHQLWGYARMAPALLQRKVKVYNLNPDSAVSVFPFKVLP